MILMSSKTQSFRYTVPYEASCIEAFQPKADGSWQISAHCAGGRSVPLGEYPKERAYEIMEQMAACFEAGVKTFHLPDA